MLKTKSREDSIFLSLEGMRGVGAAMIVVGHSLIFWPGLNIQTGLTSYLVDMFFVFSGFVIAYALEPKKHALGVTAKAFMMHRLIRLYPIYLIGILMGLVVQVLSWMDEPVDLGSVAMEVVPQFFMLPSMNPDKQWFYTLNVPAWSLFYELCANLVYILIFSYLTTRRLIALVVGFAVLLTIIAFMNGDMNVGSTSSISHMPGGFARSGFGFFLGVLIYRLNGSPTSPPKKVNVRAWALMTVFVLFAAFVPLGPWLVFAQLGAAFIYGPIAMTLAVRATAPGFIARFCVWAGGISYALYLVHVPIYVAAEKTLWRYPELAQSLGALVGIGILVVSVLLAWALDVWYDRPVRKWLYRNLRKQAAKPPSTKLQILPAE